MGDLERRFGEAADEALNNARLRNPIGCLIDKAGSDAHYLAIHLSDPTLWVLKGLSQHE